MRSSSSSTLRVSPCTLTLPIPTPQLSITVLMKLTHGLSVSPITIRRSSTTHTLVAVVSGLPSRSTEHHGGDRNWPHLPSTSTTNTPSSLTSTVSDLSLRSSS